MRLRVVSVVVALVLATPTWASEPGQPLDCRDWVFLEPGLSCSTVIPFPCGNVDVCDRHFGGYAALDNLGHMLVLEPIALGGDICGQPGSPLRRLQLRSVQDNGTSSVLAYVDDRCVDANTSDVVERGTFVFDPAGGRLLVTLFNRSIATPSSNERYEAESQRLRIDGLATLFEILQTYTPTSGPLSFRVPYMPEGFQYADYFDTYYGDLVAVGDWSQARPLQCGYPATPPSVGDYLAVEDTLPTPAPGTGRYYVTAVNYHGQRRYGRGANGEVLTGRDPVVLPRCD